MKKLIMILLPLLIFGCADQSPEVLGGYWIQTETRHVLSAEGLYDPSLDRMLDTDLSLSDDIVVFRAWSDKHEITYSGMRSGDYIDGHWRYIVHVNDSTDTGYEGKATFRRMNR
jgi:hypothetical protein